MFDLPSPVANEMMGCEENHAPLANKILSSSLAQSGGYFPELEISLSPISKTPTTALHVIYQQEAIEGN